MHLRDRGSEQRAPEVPSVARATPGNRDPSWVQCSLTQLGSLQVYPAEAAGPALSGLQSYKQKLDIIKCIM